MISTIRRMRLVLLIVLTIPSAAVSYSYQDFFPPAEEEYDPFKFDPNSLFGAPLGGYARATRSRLAALPLRFVGDSIFWQKDKQGVDRDDGDDVVVKQKDKGKPYFTITDAMGREFACRVYEEDELTPESMSDSVFDVPVEKMSSIVRGRDHTLDSTVLEKDPNEIIGDEGIDGPTFSQAVEGAEHVDSKSKETIHEDNSKHDHVEFVYTTNIDEYLESQQGASKVSSSIPDDVRIDEKVLVESLNNLEGICAQLHMGWWSYEWCYNDKVTQFHVQVQANQIKDVVSVKDLMPEFVVQSISTIGTFTKRKIIVETTLQEQVSKEGGEIDYYDNDNDDDDSGNEAQKDQDTITLETEKDVEKTQLDYTTDVLVIESYENGDYCEEAGANRVAEVHLRCCSNEDIISSFRQAGVTIHNPEMFSKPFESIDAPRAVLLDVIETSVCNYTMSVCTNVLCDSWVDNTMKEMQEEDDASAASNRVATFENDVSIRYILEKTLANSCLKRNEGWWTYSFCFKSSIYQYHESVDLDLEQGVMTAKIEASNVLGKYDPVSSEGFPKEEEVHHVIFPKGRIQGEVRNGIDLDSATSSSTTQSLVTDSAFYQQEYKHGDICEGEDVIDSAIKGGEVGEGGIQRSTTVRFFCGNSKELVRINEDHTCHYVVDITLPELCSHKYFAIPQIEKHAMKCVPL